MVFSDQHQCVRPGDAAVEPVEHDPVFSDVGRLHVGQHSAVAFAGPVQRLLQQPVLGRGDNGGNGSAATSRCKGVGW